MPKHSHKLWVLLDIFVNKAQSIIKRALNVIKWAPLLHTCFLTPPLLTLPHWSFRRKSPIFNQKSPIYRQTSHPCTHAFSPDPDWHYLNGVGVLSKELRILSKEPCMLSTEPCILSREPCMWRKKRSHTHTHTHSRTHTHTPARTHTHTPTRRSNFKDVARA